jgi:hypothetical protein
VQKSADFRKLIGLVKARVSAVVADSEKARERTKAAQAVFSVLQAAEAAACRAEEEIVAGINSVDWKNLGSGVVRGATIRVLLFECYYSSATIRVLLFECYYSSATIRVLRCRRREKLYPSQIRGGRGESWSSSILWALLQAPRLVALDATTEIFMALWYRTRPALSGLP